MAFSFRGRTIEKVGVIGSGQIGPDIALYFSKVLSRHGVSVVVVDVADAALAKGKARLEKKIDRGVKSGAFKEPVADAMKAAVTFTSDYAALEGATLVVEAATEAPEIKQKIFQALEERCGDEAILVSNSSHLEPEVIGATLKNKARSAVVHYFFPAERNYMVEVVPGADTDPEVTSWLMAFYERIGKYPIQVGSRYGYAVDPVFEGLFLVACLCVEQGLGTTKEVDAVATRALGLTVGPFTAMNLTGGNPITVKGLPNEGEKIMPWFRAPQMLVDAVEQGTAWEVPDRGEKVTVPEDRERLITEELQGGYLGLCDEIISSDIVSASDMEMAIEVALDMAPPAKLANKLGTGRALELVRAYATKHEGFAAPRWLVPFGENDESIETEVVSRRDEDGVALLTIRRPKSLNSLDDAAFRQLRGHFADIKDDASVQGIVLTGFGTKAFVSGADVKFLARINTPEDGMRDSKLGQQTTLDIEGVGKPVVCAMNGMTFGGGMEIALSCTSRVAAPLKVLGGQPEVNLGIIPGAGATQRLPRLIGLEKAAELLRTGRPFSSEEAAELGVVDEVVGLDELVPRAMTVARELAAGTREARPLIKTPLETVPAALPELDLGHRSKAVDAIISRAILDGAKQTLEAGLALENALFGEVCGTKDMRIGIDTFLNEGPRAKAAFEHR